MPFGVVRIQFCEKMGWTFEEFDNTPVQDVMDALEVWKVLDMHSDGREG